MNKQKLLDQVVTICRNYPEAANNDAILLEQVWLAQGWDNNRSLHDNLSRVSRPESISRRRREAHVKGLITYSETAMKDRTEAFNNEVRDNSPVRSYV